jgi:hypothetical protein
MISPPSAVFLSATMVILITVLSANRQDVQSINSASPALPVPVERAGKWGYADANGNLN